MKNIIGLFLALSLAFYAPEAQAALATGTIFTLNASATANFANGAGFNPASANFLTDLAATSANTSAPVVTSASYNFVAGDVNSYVYVKSGTHWQAGWYKIASVASNAATLDAAIGHVVLSVDQQGTATINTVVGCTSDATATLSSGTYGVDYSQVTAANATSTTATSSGAGSVILFSGSTQAMIGNLVHVVSGTNFTAGWYEITGESTGVSITTDRAVTTGVGASGTINIGGAGNFGSLEDSFQSIIPAQSLVFVKNGSYTLSAAISTANSNCTAANACFWIGYNSQWGDNPTGSSRPTFISGANQVAMGGTQIFKNWIITITNSSGFNSAQLLSSKITNTSSTANATAFAGAIAVDSELISLNGSAMKNTGNMFAIGNYFHDSKDCFNENSTNQANAYGNLFEACDTDAILASASGLVTAVGNTIYGREGKIGIGINLGATAPNNRIVNNIFYGLTTGINVPTSAANNNFGYYNDYNNNTTDVTNWLKGPSAIALNPQFTNASQLTNTGTVTGNTTTLTDTGASFGVTDNVDVLHVTAISGSGCVTGKYMITGHTTTTLTLNNSLGGASCTAITYFVTHGHDFSIGTNLKAKGFPTFTNDTGGQTTGYMDNGAVQRQEPAGGGTVGYGAP